MENMRDLPPEAWNPMAPLDWRWQIACQIFRGQARRGDYREPIIHDAVACLRQEPSPSAPLVRWACRLAGRQSLLRWEIEARILAGETDDVIAEKCEHAPEQVRVYEQLFFGVRPFLEATDWLHQRTVGNARFIGFRNHQVREYWAMIALNAPHQVLDLLIETYQQAVDERGYPGLLYYLQEAGPLPLGLQAQVALSAFPRTTTADRWLDRWVARLEKLKTVSCKVRASELGRTILREVIACGKTILAGHALPKIKTRSRIKLAKRPRTSPKSKAKKQTVGGTEALTALFTFPAPP